MLTLPRALLGETPSPNGPNEGSFDSSLQELSNDMLGGVKRTVEKIKPALHYKHTVLFNRWPNLSREARAFSKKGFCNLFWRKTSTNLVVEFRVDNLSSTNCPS